MDLNNLTRVNELLKELNLVKELMTGISDNWVIKIGDQRSDFNMDFHTRIAEKIFDELNRRKLEIEAELTSL